MNKSALKKFATEARRELLDRVKLQAARIGINAETIEKANVESSDAVYIGERRLTNIERRQRNKLIARIEEVGYNRVMEETAYTWFNRFIALRYMEVNDYLPTKVRVLSSANPSSAEPDMIKEALSIDLDLDKEYVYQLKMDNDTDELFKYLIKMHCNDLYRYMPFMFETIEDYTEILFPEGLLGTDSFVRRMTDTEFIPEDNWRQIEVIGWLYQYYIAEEKDRVFKAKAKYKAEEIPYATQLFTPNWIVRYMVQNSLGRYWTEAHPEHEDLKTNWEFFIEHQEEDFLEKIAPYVHKELNVEDIKCFDPAMGSGHILVYMFDVLFEIYSKCGYVEREIPRLIIERNLYGLDIDDRANQLASFSIVMKALEYNRRFLRSIEREGLKINLASIQETNGWTDELIAYIAGKEVGNEFESLKEVFEQYINAKTFGSLLKVTRDNTDFLRSRLKEIKENPVNDLFSEEIRDQALSILPLLIKQIEIMVQKYDIIVMNPPYMGSGSMNKELSEFLKKYYSDSKADLFAAFMDVNHYLKKNGFYAAINQHSWMFLSSFNKLREKVISKVFIDTMMHLGPRAFEEISGEVVQSTTFVLRNTELKDNKSYFIRLINEKSAEGKKNKAIEEVKNPSASHNFSINQNDFTKIPGSPIAYWVSKKVLDVFNNNLLIDYASPKQGFATGKNDIFLRYWHEVSYINCGWGISNRKEAKESKLKWFPCNKGGGYRKWFGNNYYVANWENDGYAMRNFAGSVIRNPNFYFQEGLTWSTITSGNLSMRYSPEGHLFETKGSVCFVKERQHLYYFLGLLNSNIINNLLLILSPTLDYHEGPIGRIPVIIQDDKIEEVNKLVLENIRIAKSDWDDYEISWGFQKHPFISFNSTTIKDSFERWVNYKYSIFNKLKQNEERLNEIFIYMYNLQDEITPNLSNEEISLIKPCIDSDVKRFISYFIGCSFGRFSLDEEGLIYAGGKFETSHYSTFPVDQDNIMPILAGKYFEDDILTRFEHFVRVTFSEAKLEENLDFIADTIGRKANETARETLRRYLLNDFYKDHLQVYKRRPLYWLFTSGKEKAFNCLIYMHRYDKTTLSRIRTDYLHPVQIRMDAEREELLAVIEGDSTTKEINQAKRELRSLEKKIDELKAYDEKLHHMADMQIEIDLDDGVKVNYEKFKGLVAKI